MLLRIAICEDNNDDMSLLAEAIEKSDILTNQEFFVSGEELLEDFVPGKYDLIFLDIYMEGLTGIETAKKIREEDKTVMLVFITTSLSHALESYRLKALFYIEKPIKDEDIKETLSLAAEKKKSASYISLHIDGKMQEFSLESIIYFEVRDHVVYVNTVSETFRTAQKVKINRIEKLLPETFLRCHYSYIVNLRYVKYLNTELKTFIMHNDDIAYISSKLFKKAKKAYENYLFSKPI